MSLLSNNLQTQRVASSVTCYDAVIVGAGPYGLSVAAHLLARGVHTSVFGRPMELWRDHMPGEMRLRSYWWATSLSDPHRRHDLGRYFEELGQEPQDPLPIATIIAYGLWFQKHVVPIVDETYVERITRMHGQFELTLADSRTVQSSVVVMAPGLRYYLYRAPEYDWLPPEVVSHTAEHRDFERFSGKQVAVIGGGQSATETAALLHESGARVHLVARRSIVWNREATSGPRPLKERLISPQGGIGRGWNLWLLEHVPYTFHRFSRSKKDRLLGTIAGPAAASWLRPRISGNIVIHEQQNVDEVRATAGGVRLVLSNHDTLQADHVILGTGYRVDVGNLPMLDPELLADVETYHRAPVLTSWFESSVPRLYFMGISSVSSCGPLFRFVVGTEAAARRVANSVVRRQASIR